MGYWIVGFAVALIAFLCVRNIVKDLRRGQCVGCSLGGCAKCGGSCASCGGSCGQTGTGMGKKEPEAEKTMEALGHK